VLAAILDDGGALVEEFSFINDSFGIDRLVSELSTDDRVVM
jgi:hypothetical protein